MARRQADQALVPAASSPQAVSTEGFDPSRIDRAQPIRNGITDRQKAITR